MLNKILLAGAASILVASCGGSSNSNNNQDTPGAGAGDRSTWAEAALRPGDPDAGAGEAGGENFVIREGAQRDEITRLYTELATSDTNGGGYVWENGYSNSTAYYIEVDGETTQDGVAIGSYYFGDPDGDQDPRILAVFSGETYGAPSSDVTFDGTYNISTADGVETIETDIVVDTAQNTLTSSTVGLEVNGTISGNDFSGTVTYNDADAELNGGFFGDELLGAFLADDYAGTVYGSSQ